MQTPVVDPRAVQLGSLFVRGLTYLIAANSACGFPFPMGELMPWKTFDGLLFHSKYLQAHSGSPKEELLEGNVSTGKCHWPCLHLVLTSGLDDPITSGHLRQILTFQSHHKHDISKPHGILVLAK